MTQREQRQLQAIATGIKRGDYTGLKGEGERLVFQAARDVGATAPELIRLWASGATTESRRTVVTVMIDDDADRDPDRDDDHPPCDEDDPDSDCPTDEDDESEEGELTDDEDDRTPPSDDADDDD